MNRRTFLSASTVLPFAITPSFLSAQTIPNKKAVIWVWLSGGATHIETFNPIPDGPDTHRSVTGSIQTAVPGIQLGGHFENMAKNAKNFTFVRSFGHISADHARATHLLHTAREFQGSGNEQSWPCLGSIVSENFGGVAQNGLPLYIKSGSVDYDRAGWLGARYNPFDMNGDLRKHKLTKEEEETLKMRGRALSELDQFHKDRPEIQNLNKIKQQTYDLVFGSGRNAFETKDESQAVKDSYGQFGNPFLVARRLVQNGVRFVSINTGGWDNHQGIQAIMGERCPPIDIAISALVNDLGQNGLLEDTLIVVTSEFGRSPLNKNGGRDHLGKVCPLVFAGGSYDHGRIIGKTNNTATEVADGLVGPMDLMATVFNHCGISSTTRKTDLNGRPMKLNDGGKCIL